MKVLMLNLKHPLARFSCRTRPRYSTFNKNNNICYYNLLGVAKDSSTEEIRKRFFELAKIHHPDISSNPESNEIFQNLSEAYGILSNPDLRADYDRVKGYDREPTEDMQLNEEELSKQMYEKYNKEKNKKNRHLFNIYFKEKYLKKDWELKDPMNPLNFYSEMYDQKIADDKKTAEV